MGAGASAAESRVFCHHCGARTPCGASASDAPECLSCGAKDGVELTDSRLPLTETSPGAGVPNPGRFGVYEGVGDAGSSSAATGSNDLASRAAAAAAASTSGPVRVESVTVVAVQRPEDGGLLLRVLPNVVPQRPGAGSPRGAADVQGVGDAIDDWEAPPEPACPALVSRLQAELLGPDPTKQYGVCVICADDISEVGTPVIELGCGHAFHEECIRQWLTRRHTCPVCRLEMEVDSVRYLRSIGLSEEADELEKVELARQEQELQKQAAARRRWVESMRRGVPVHFGMSCARCGDTPLTGDCYRCPAREGYTLCGECFTHREESDHLEDHAFEQFGAIGGGGFSDAHDAPPGQGGLLTVLVRPPQRDAGAGGDHEDEAVSSEAASPPMRSDAAMAAAEAAFAAVRSLALAPLASSTLPEAATAAAPAAEGDAQGAGSSMGSHRVQQPRHHGR